MVSWWLTNSALDFPHMPVNPSITRSAFTIIEVIVVVIMIAVLAGVIVPRLGGGAAREAGREAEAVAALITDAAQAAELSPTPIAVRFTKDTGRFETLGASAVGAEWTPRSPQRPVDLSASVLTSAMVDGSPRPLEREVLIEWLPGSVRPSISLVMQIAGEASADARAWQVDLGPGARLARVRGLMSASAAVPPADESIDLDAGGQRSTPW